MDEHIFSKRQMAIEADYFRHEDARLLEMLRQNAGLDEVAVALRDRLQVDNPNLLRRVRELGVTVDTAPALFLAPLVQVAWAEGKTSKQDHHAVLRFARRRGIDVNSPAYAQLDQWLRIRPSNALFDTAIEILKYGYDVLPPLEREERIKAILQACQDIAEASGHLGKLLGLGNGVSSSEAATIESIMRDLRSHG